MMAIFADVSADSRPFANISNVRSLKSESLKHVWESEGAAQNSNVVHFDGLGTPPRASFETRRRLRPSKNCHSQLIHPDNVVLTNAGRCPKIPYRGPSLSTLRLSAVSSDIPCNTFRIYERRYQNGNSGLLI